MCLFHIFWGDRSWTLDKTEPFPSVWGTSLKQNACGSGWAPAELVFIDFWSYALWMETFFYRDQKDPHSSVREHIRDIRGDRSYWFWKFCPLLSQHHCLDLGPHYILPGPQQMLRTGLPVSSTIAASFLQLLMVPLWRYLKSLLHEKLFYYPLVPIVEFPT